jgi:hypothetical protein
MIVYVVQKQRTGEVLGVFGDFKPAVDFVYNTHDEDMILRDLPAQEFALVLDGDDNRIIIQAEEVQ